MQFPFVYHIQPNKVKCTSSVGVCDRTQIEDKEKKKKYI